MIKHFNFRLGKKNLIFLLLLFFLSTLFYLSITLDQPVIFEDPNFELAVRELLGHSGKPVYRSQLLSIIELDIAGRGISNLSGIENFRNLRDLNLSNNKISDVGLLHTLNNLRRLDLGYNEIIDLETANFNSILHLDLKYLNLDHNFVLDSYDRPIKLSDIELLHHFDNLEILSLEGNWIKEFNPVTDFENIQLLNMRDNQIKDINFLEKMPNLEHLNMRGNRLAEISVIGELTELEYLNLHSNKFIKSIQPLGNLTRLEKLILRNVPVDDVSIF